MKIWTIEEMKTLIATNDRVLYRALIVLYNGQTADEKRDGATRYTNGIGFNGVDAPILTAFTEFLKRNKFLTDKQKTLARKKLPKYAKQLVKVANDMEAEKAKRAGVA